MARQLFMRSHSDGYKSPVLAYAIGRTRRKARHYLCITVATYLRLPPRAMWRALDVLSRYIATHSCRQVPPVRLDILNSLASLSLTRQPSPVARDDSDTTRSSILHSRFHEIWSLRLGTSLEDRPHATPRLIHSVETFPFPRGLTPDDPRRRLR